MDKECEYCESPHNLLERKCLDKNCKQIHTICENCLNNSNPDPY